jgi:DNA-binding LytR/AlgR family response regulator
MPTALIAEDEPLLAAALRTELAQHWPALRIVAQVGDGLSATAEALAQQPDVCFLDIRMPGCSGLEAAQALAEDWEGPAPLPLLVFVTAFEQYALQAFEAQAVDYLVKPVDGTRLAACIQRLQQRLSERDGLAARAAGPSPDTPGPEATGAAGEAERVLAQLRALLAAPALDGHGPAAGRAAPPHPPPRLEVIQAQVGSMVHLVPVDTVIYFEAADKYLRVVTAEREHLIRLPLKELLPQLDPARFWQVHRGTIVQARCITQAQREESGKVTLSLRDRPETLVASRLYAHRFKGL